MKSSAGTLEVIQWPLNITSESHLKTPIPEQGLHAGDVATLVELVEHPGSGPRGCVIEVFNAVGESIAVVTVPETAVESLRADEIFSVRTLSAS